MINPEGNNLKCRLYSYFRAIGIQRRCILLTHILVINHEKCTGCRNCELACSVQHTGTFNPARSRIQVLKEEHSNLIAPMVCLQCESPLCKDACPTGAIMYNDHDTLYVNPDVCIGCLSCVTACVYGGVTLDTTTKKAIKCDLCNGDPACLKACEYDAISYQEKGKGEKARFEGTKITRESAGISQEVQ